MLELDIGFTNPDAATQAKQQGRIATWGKGATGPVGWKDASCVNKSLAGVMMVSAAPIAQPLMLSSDLVAGHTKGTRSYKLFCWLSAIQRTCSYSPERVYSKLIVWQEYIVYDIAQVKMRYLLRVEMR